jgi:hypothetical protein
MISSALWALPLTNLFFIALTLWYRQSFDHIVLTQMKVFFFSFGFSCLSVFLQQKTRSMGLSIFFSLLIVTAGLIHEAVGVAFFAAGAYSLWSLRAVKERLFSPAVTLIFTVTLVVLQFPYFSLEYSQPFSEFRIRDGGINSDTMYHVALASMIKNYFSISHGLHGLGPLEYHFGSHVLMASVSKMLHITTFDSYSFVFVFFVIPLLSVCLLVLSEEINRSVTFRDLISKHVLYITLMVATGMFISGSPAYKFALWPSFFESESYTLSIILYFCLVSALYALDRFKYSVNQKNIILCLVIPAIIFCATAAKISFGAFALLTFGVWAIWPLLKDVFKGRLLPLILGDIPRFSALLISIVGFVILRPLISPVESAASINVFSFVYENIKVDFDFPLNIFVFVLVHFSFPLFLFVWLIFLKFVFKVDFHSHHWLIASTVTVTLIGMVAILTLWVPGGSATYISNPSMFCALPLLIGFVPMAYQFFCTNISPTDQVLWRGFFRHPSTIVVVFLTGYALLSYGLPTVQKGFKDFRTGISGSKSQLFFSNYITALESIRSDPSTLDALIYIPRRELGFWQFHHCKIATYFITAVSERPALWSWPDARCYPFLCTKRFTSGDLCTSSLVDHDDDEIRSETARLGFKRALVVTSEGIRTVASE